MKIPFFDVAANSLIRQMSKNTLEKLTKAPEEQQAEIIGQIYEISKDFLKREFIKYTIEAIKNFNNEGETE